MCRIRICLYCHKTPESNTEVTAFASIIQDIFRPLKKKKKGFPSFNWIKWWHQCNPRSDSNVQIRPVIVNEINIETQPTCNDGTQRGRSNFLPISQMNHRASTDTRYKPLPLLFDTRKLLIFSLFLPRPTCKDFFCCWKLPCWVSTFQPDYRYKVSHYVEVSLWQIVRKRKCVHVYYFKWNKSSRHRSVVVHLWAPLNAP